MAKQKFKTKFQKALTTPLTKKQIQDIIIVFIFIFATAFISVFTAYLFANIEVQTRETRTTEISEELQEFIDLYYKLTEDHYFEIDKSALINSAIRGMIEAIEDEHTSYMNSSENYSFQQRVRGQYQGIGIGLFNNEEEEIEISEVFPNTPAERAGVQIGDIILEIDGNDLTEEDTSFVVNYIRFIERDYVEMVFLRDNERITKQIDIETVILPSVNSEIIIENDLRLGYLEISIFALNSYSQFLQELSVLENEPIDGLIIDLRYNTGGFLSTAERIISTFLDDSHVIYRTEEKGEEKTFYSRGNETKEYPIVILGNHASASASEIMIAALQESYGATFVGTNTHGKGTVQEIIDLPDEDALRYTARIWLTPEGTWIDDVGITPDYEVIQDPEYFITLERNDDTQFQKALEVLIDKLK